MAMQLSINQYRHGKHEKDGINATEAANISPDIDQ
jgi:hypothetical protein